MSSVGVTIKRSDGKKFVLGGSGADSEDWLITELSGIDSPEHAISSETNAVGYGSTVMGMQVTGRIINIKANVKNRYMNDILRRVAVAFFNEVYSFDLYITYMNETRWISGMLDGFSCPSKNIYESQELSATFYCENPYMKSVDDFGKNIASIYPMFAFPYIQTDKIKVVASRFNFARTVEIENDGDIETYMHIIIRMSGNVKNPLIFRDDKIVRILGEFVVDDVIDIDMINLTVKLNGENAINMVDRKSDFTNLNLNVGDNTIGYRAENGDNLMNVEVYFNKLYRGL